MSEATLRLALVQLNCSDNEEANLDRAELLFDQAVTDGAELVAFPENMVAIWPSLHSVDAAEALDGPRVARLSSWAQRSSRWVLAGSVPIKTDDPQRIRNTSILFGPDGDIVATYAKIHLFDVQVGEHAFRESDQVEGGQEVVVAQTPWGGLGLTLCYDLRFPELYQSLVEQGASIIAAPSAFTYDTGKAHWATLVQARAIDTQCFLVAPNQWGPHAAKRHSWGQSMIVDPWGLVLAQKDDGEGLVVAELDLDVLHQVRERMPLAQHRNDRPIDL